MSVRKSIIIEAISLFTGICLFVVPLLKMQNIYSGSSQPKEGQNKIHIQINYADFRVPNEPLLSLKKIPKTKNVEVTLDFINWHTYEINCNQMMIDTPSKISSINYSKHIDGITTSGLWSMDKSSVTWDMLEKHT